MNFEIILLTLRHNQKNGHEDKMGIGVPHLVKANTFDTCTDS